MTVLAHPEAVAAMPALFIVGAPRCGTTSLAAALAQHPRLAFSAPKEPHFFTALADPIDPERARRRYLERHFAHLSSAHRVLGEGSVSTLYDPAAVKRIRRCFPAARFVVMIRNPLDLLPSYHQRMLFLLDEDQPNFRKAWDLRRQRAAGRRLPRDCRDPNLLRYEDIGRLGAAVDNLFAVAGAERCHVIMYDDYVRESQRVLDDVLASVGLKAEVFAPIERRNVNRVYRYRWLQRVFRRPNPKIASAVTRANTAKRKPGFIPRTVFAIKRWNTIKVRRQPLDAAFQAELAATYREDIAKLSRLIGRDLTPWLEGCAIAPRSDAAAPIEARETA